MQYLGMNLIKYVKTLFKNSNKTLIKNNKE